MRKFGLCFANFTNTVRALIFWKAFNKYKWNTSSNRKTCAVSLTTTQGKEEHLPHTWHLLKWKFFIPNKNKNVSFLYTNDLLKNDYFHFLWVMPKGSLTIHLGMDDLKHPWCNNIIILKMCNFSRNGLTWFP